MKRWVVALVWAVLLVYIVVGGLIFMVLESRNEEDTIEATGEYRSQFLGNFSCVSSEELDTLVQQLYSSFAQGVVSQNNTGDVERTWTAHTSIYFATTVVTTIGYGNISPATTGGRVFCIFFALVGIPLCLVVLAGIGTEITGVVNKLNKSIEKRLTVEFCLKHPKLLKLFCFLSAHVLGLVLFVLIPAVIFQKMEEGWSYGDAIYYSFITLTTVGFGDYVAGFNGGWGHPLYRVMIACWIIIGLSWMSSMIAMTQELLDNRVANIDKKSIDEEQPGKQSELIDNTEKAKMEQNNGISPTGILEKTEL